MVKVERPSDEKLVVEAAPTPKWGTGIAYLILAGLFIYLGVTEGRPLSTGLGVLNLVFAFFTLSPRSRTTIVFDKSKGDFTLRRKSLMGASEVTHKTSEIKEVEVRSIKALWREVFFLNFKLGDDRQFAIQHSLDTDKADKMAAAEAIQGFLKR